jgi:DNA-binding winged helix-turn-helix (wHTH) protein
MSKLPAARVTLSETTVRSSQKNINLSTKEAKLFRLLTEHKEEEIIK